MSQDKEHIVKHSKKAEFTETYSDANPANKEDEISLKEIVSH